MRKNKVFIVDITTEVGPEDEYSLTNTQYFVYKVMDSASTKFRKSINASFVVQMPALVSRRDLAGKRVNTRVWVILDQQNLETRLC